MQSNGSDDANKFKKQNFSYKSGYGTSKEGRGLASHQKNKIIQKYEKASGNQRLAQGEHHKYEETSYLKSATTEEWDDFNSVFGGPMVKKHKGSKLYQAKQGYEDKKLQRQEQRISKVNKRKEIEEKRQKYKEKKLERNKKLSKKTRKGQPIMQARMDLLLDSIIQMKNKT